MKAVLQRVSRAEVRVRGQVCGAIGRGLVVLLGIAPQDTEQDADRLAEKIVTLRIHDDNSGKMNLDLLQIQGALLIVSQFTLYADCRKGRRPSFIQAAPPQQARRLYERFIDSARSLGVPVATGEFGAEMEVEIVNSGPVTIILDTRELFGAD
ncbi:MAG: D-aminoacyl-tRNA deacylase [Gemmatales bacterium]|nr:D-aminoacyl-tRNA deacylase [Gemmatales bacterium]MDW8221567.1 D-aminoacyl-tRNA deacylase [Gemmatales bacterium]